MSAGAHYRFDSCRCQRSEMFIYRLQNSPLTSWIWQFWLHKETGRVVMFPFWKNPGRKYSNFKMKE